jgi:hypothetical protein
MPEKGPMALDAATLKGLETRILVRRSTLRNDPLASPSVAIHIDTLEALVAAARERLDLRNPEKS